MKDTPAGVEGSEGITTPPGSCPSVRSIAGKPPWVGIEGIGIGGPCCITAELGGEEPPGGKKTWAMAPEGIQGLALAIQSPVCRLPDAFNIYTHKNMPRGRTARTPTVVSTSGARDKSPHWHMDRHWAKIPGLLCDLCPPLRLDSREKSLSGALCFFLLQAASFTLWSADSCYCRSMTSMSNVCQSLIKETQWVGEGVGKLPSSATSFPLSPLLSKEVVLHRRKSKLDCETPRQERKQATQDTMPNLVVALLQVDSQNGLLRQETVRIKSARGSTAFTSLTLFQFQLQFSLFCEKAQTERVPPSTPPSCCLLCTLVTAKEEVKWLTEPRANRLSQSSTLCRLTAWLLPPPFLGFGLLVLFAPTLNWGHQKIPLHSLRGLLYAQKPSHAFLILLLISLVPLCNSFLPFLTSRTPLFSMLFM